ncbi:MAG: radical SAM protein [Firmicutes bacterium]|nr:radical SAM protein [Bacillota bacterium]
MKETIYHVEALTIIIKPTEDCNLRCSYCYNNKLNYSPKKMTITECYDFFDWLTKSVSKIQLIWHGGEPLTMGLDFFREVVEIQKNLTLDRNVEFENLLQTNGTLITLEFAEFFKKNKFRIGISYDGEFGDTGRPKKDSAKQGINTLLNIGVKPAIFNVITTGNSQFIYDIYRKYNELGLSVKFETVFNDGEAKKNDLSLDSDYEIALLKNFFDYWLFDLECRIRVDPFKQIIDACLGHVKQCSNSSCLYRYISINSNGDLYPCGRNYPDEFYLGNLKNFISLEDLFSSKKYNSLVNAAIVRRKSCIKYCKHYEICQGGCNSDAIIGGDITKNGHAKCRLYYQLVEHVKEKISYVKKEKIDVNPTIKTMFINA